MPHQVQWSQPSATCASATWTGCARRWVRTRWRWRRPRAERGRLARPKRTRVRCWISATTLHVELGLPGAAVTLPDGLHAARGATLLLPREARHHVPEVPAEDIRS